MNDTIKLLLASFFEKFKVNNPKAYLAIIVGLAGIYGALSTPEFAELTGSPSWLTTALKVLVFAMALLGGTHTSALTGKDKKIF